MYRQNRSRFSTEELRPYYGRWVAFSSDGRRLIGGADSLRELTAQLRDAQEDPQQVVFEKIEFDADEISLGGATQL
jgi:hypothetical protein